jgi:hypothetical protein
LAQDQIELISGLIDAVNEGDWDTWRSLRARASRDFQYDMTRSVGLLRGIYGYDEMPGLLGEYLGVWEEARFQIEDWLAVGERLVTPFHTRHEGRDGIEVTARAAWVWEFADGLLSRQTLYQSLEEALAAAR